MENQPINYWEQTVEQANKDYQEYFDFEKEYLSKNLQPNQRVIDIGCGDGRSIMPIAAQAKEFIGIDHDPVAIKDALVNFENLEKATALQADATKLPLEKKSVDIAFIGLTFVNFGEDKEKALAEIKRVLKDGGKLIFSVFSENALNARKQMYDKYDVEYEVTDDKGTVYFPEQKVVSEQFSEEEIKRILDQAGFKITDFQKGNIFYMISAVKNN